MKYIYAFLILIGGVAGLLGLVILFIWLADKIKEWEFNIERKHKKYRHFKEKVLPVMVGILILCVFLIGLTSTYFVILEIV